MRFQLLDYIEDILLVFLLKWLHLLLTWWVIYSKVISKAAIYIDHGSLVAKWVWRSLVWPSVGSHLDCWSPFCRLFWLRTCHCGSGSKPFLSWLYEIDGNGIFWIYVILFVSNSLCIFWIFQAFRTLVIMSETFKFGSICHLIHSLNRLRLEIVRWGSMVLTICWLSIHYLFGSIFLSLAFLLCAISLSIS